MVVKQKASGIISARLAMGGHRQLKATYNSIYAGTSDTTNRAFILSYVLADAAVWDRPDSLVIGDFDFPGAFLHNRLTRELTNGYQLLVRLPNDLSAAPNPSTGTERFPYYPVRENRLP